MYVNSIYDMASLEYKFYHLHMNLRDEDINAHNLSLIIDLMSFEGNSNLYFTPSTNTTSTEDLISSLKKWSSTGN